MRKTRVMIIDDSALVRQLLTEIINREPDFEVVAVANDPYSARSKILALSPDVITLDVEMPKMDGLTFLGHLMSARPTPVVMISSLTKKGADVTLNALALGAVDFVSKPERDILKSFAACAAEIMEKLRTASVANVRGAARERVEKIPAAALEKNLTHRVIAIGASTGGTEAIHDILAAMPPDAPSVVIAQHIPEAFSKAFADRLGKASAMTVHHAEDRMPLLPGHAYVAPGGLHLRIAREGARYTVRVEETERVNRHRPSVDVLFHSVAESCGPSAVGVLLTGMGADGSRGLFAMRERGAFTIAQDQATSVVWGMPGEAVRLGAVDDVLPISKIAAALIRRARAS